VPLALAAHSLLQDKEPHCRKPLPASQIAGMPQHTPLASARLQADASPNMRVQVRPAGHGDPAIPPQVAATAQVPLEATAMPNVAAVVAFQ